ncbi:MAG: hypothetical protein JW827_02285 [Spirochaetes bacterium]|nr:hypothetical protein [Spirochaetota bacterium]
MFQKSYNILAALILCAFLLYCGGGKQVKEDDMNAQDQEGTKTIVAEGLAEVRQAGVPEAYDRAKEQALKKAIETALGTIIDARIIGSSGVILEENIYAKKQGYIKQWEPVSKRVEDGVAYFKVKAVVGMQRLKDDVMALEILQHRMNLPKTIIFVYEEVEGKPSKQKTAYNILIEKFTEKKFVMISPSSISATYSQNINQLYKYMETDENAFISTAGKLGMDVNADIVIVGKTIAQKAQQLEVYGKTSKMKSSQTDGEFKVVNVGDGRILAAISKRGAGVHMTPESAGISGIEKVTEPAADDLIKQILEAWEDVLNNGNLITLYVKGLTLTDEIKFSNALKQYYREVKEVYQKQKKGVFSVFTLRFLGTPRDCATALVTKEAFPYKVDVQSYDFGRVTVSAKVK